MFCLDHWPPQYKPIFLLETANPKQTTFQKYSKMIKKETDVKDLVCSLKLELCLSFSLSQKLGASWNWYKWRAAVNSPSIFMFESRPITPTFFWDKLKKTDPRSDPKEHWPMTKKKIRGISLPYPAYPHPPPPPGFWQQNFYQPYQYVIHLAAVEYRVRHREKSNLYNFQPKEILYHLS